MEQPSQILKQWDRRTSADDRKEVYENLMGNPEFGRFLGILKDFQQEAYQQALSRPEEANFYLGGADIINAVKTDIEAILGNGPAVF